MQSPARSAVGPMKKAKELMTRDVMKVDKDDRLETVLDAMVKHRVSKLVVVDKGQVVGVVTDGDIADELGAIKNRGVPASHLHASSAMRRKFPSVGPETELPAILVALIEEDAGILPVVHERTPLGVVTASDVLALVTSERPIGEIMTDRLHVVAPTDRVIHARRVMLDHHVERLPVLDHGRLVGILGELDLAVGFARFKDTVSDHHQSAGLTRFLVQDVMQPSVVTATPDASARQAVAMMRNEDVGSLPVMRGDRVVGIVTRTDLLRLAHA